MGTAGVPLTPRRPCVTCANFTRLYIDHHNNHPSTLCRACAPFCTQASIRLLIHHLWSREISMNSTMIAALVQAEPLRLQHATTRNNTVGPLSPMSLYCRFGASRFRLYVLECVLTFTSCCLGLVCGLERD